MSSTREMIRAACSWAASCCWQGRRRQIDNIAQTSLCRRQKLSGTAVADLNNCATDISTIAVGLKALVQRIHL